MTGFSQSTAEQFSERVLGVLDDAALALVMSVGQRLGLFDTLASLSWATSEEIAHKAQLEERYVREWLGALVVGSVVEYEPKDATYLLPPEHAASLCESFGDGFFNFAGFAQFIPLLAQVEDPIVDCFRDGGGVPYTQYPTFQDLMAQFSDILTNESLVEATLPGVGIVERLEQGIDVLDVGCGKGHALQVAAKAFPASRFTGIDFSEEAVVEANQECKEAGLTNAIFKANDAAAIDEDSAFDFIWTFDAIHDQAKPAVVLKNIHRALRPGGTYLMAEPTASSNLEENIGQTFATLNYTVSLMHCMTVSLAYGGEGLGAMWGKEMALDYLKDAGFQTVEVKTMEHDFDNNYFVATK